MIKIKYEKFLKFLKILKIEIFVKLQKTVDNSRLKCYYVNKVEVRLR